MSEDLLKKSSNGSTPSMKPSILQVSRPFFTSAELSYLHSFTIPENKKLSYNQRKHQIFQYAFQIIKVLKFPLRVLSTTMNYYQRWYLFNKFEENNENNDFEKDPYVILLTCLFLASKNEDCIKKLKDIQAVGNKLRDDKLMNQQAYVDSQRKSIMNIEFKLLQNIKFDFINGSSIQSIDQLVVQFCKKLKIDYKNSTYSWLISFDLMSTPLCLMVPPHCVALAIIIVTLNIKPREIQLHYKTDEPEILPNKLNEILEKIDCYEDFRCPEPLVNEAIIYILDYYVHQMNFSILNEYMPSIDFQSGKEQIFKFMDLKTRFNDLKILVQKSCSNEQLLKQDEYLRLWDFSTGLKGSARFMLSNKRRRFNLEAEKLESEKKEYVKDNQERRSENMRDRER